MLGHVKISNAKEMAFRLEAKGKEAGSMLETALDDIANVVWSLAKGYAPERTGNLKSAISVDAARRSGPKGRTAEVYIDPVKAPYGVWVNEGTGIFGKRGKPIMAKPGNMLIFQIGDRTVMTRSVKGQKGQHFMERAFDEVEKSYGPVRIDRLAEQLADF